MTTEVVDKNIVVNINNKRPEMDENSAETLTNPVLAPYHRTLQEIEKMPVLERTKTVCPECKLIVDVLQLQCQRL